MNKKTIVNRTLPLIIALFVVVVVAICVTVFSGSKKTPMVDNKSDAYLTVNLGYEKPIIISKEELYGKLKNGSNGLSYLVDILDSKLLSEKGYIQKVSEQEIKEAIELAIFGKDYEYDPENLDADNEKIETYVKNMYASYGISIKKESIQIKDSALSVSLTGEDALKEYFTLSVARKNYTIDEMGVDQKESYEEFIKAYEDYLVELYKYKNDEVTTAPTTPTDGSTVTTSAVQTDFESENVDNYWALVVKYATKAEAEQALLQAGVVIYNSKWYNYEGIIDLNDYKNEDGSLEYKTLASYYSAKGTALNKFEIQSKLIELYNNSVLKDEQLVEGVNYTVKELSKAEYDALSDSTKDEKYTEVKEEGKDSVYKAVIFNNEVKKDAEGNADFEAKENALYYADEKLEKLDSSIKSYIKSLSSLYVDGSTWTKSFSNSIQAKGSYYVLAFKFTTIEATDFDDEEAYGKFYDDDKYEDGVAEEDLANLKVGYVPYTRDAEGNLTFNYDGNKYWTKVEELLKDKATATKIDEYMAKLRVENKLVIFDELIEAQYMNTYSSEYKATKKSSSSVVAKLTIDGKAFEVKADDLYAKLEASLGGITAADAYQYHNVLAQNDIIDYAKYLSGASLDNCVIITEYALTKPGSKDPVTKWVKADHDGLVEFTNVDGTVDYDVVVRKGVKGEEKVTETFEAGKIEIEDESAKKTTVTVTVSNDAHYHDPENTYLGLDDTIASLKLYFTNGNFADYGYDASYGWKNFLRDYFATYYGITIENNEDLKLYYIYEDTVEHLTEELAKTNEESWANIYVPYMQQAYDKFFSVDAVHFLISVTDKDGNMADPAAEDTAWTAEQKAAAEELYDLVYRILRKTKSTSQATVLGEIVDAFDAAPKFITGKGETTAEQQAYIDSQDKYVEKNEEGEVIYKAIEYTTEIKGITLEVSKYKTLGLSVKYEDLGTVTADKMVENFENALKLMWNTMNVKDAGMQSGTALESNEFYDDYAQESEYLTTEFGYHVLIANKFTGKAVDELDENNKNYIITLPSYEDVLVYEADGEEVDDLPDYNISQIETYYSTVAKDFSQSYWYQLNVMKQLIASINEGKELQFANAAAKERTLKLAEHYVDTYYGSLTYIAKGYKAATNLMEIFVDAYNGYDFAVKNADADYVEKFAAKVENLKVILTAAENAIKEVKVAELNGTETKEFNELKAEFDAAKEAFNKLAK